MAKRKRKPSTRAALNAQLRHLDRAARPPGIMSVTSCCDSYLVQDHTTMTYEARAAAELVRRQLPRGRGVGRGGVELPAEAHQAVAELELIYRWELQKPRAKRRTMAEIVADYRPLMATLVTPKQLLKLWKHTREKAAAEGKEAARGKP